MGGSDSYCALCGGPLYPEVQIGPPTNPQRPFDEDDYEYNCKYDSNVLQDEQVNVNLSISFYTHRFQVLAHAVGTTKSIVCSSMADFDLDILYTCMEQSELGVCSKTLALDYYEAQKASTEQWWISTRGQEGLVADPVDIPRLHNYYKYLPHHAQLFHLDLSLLEEKQGVSNTFNDLPLMKKLIGVSEGSFGLMAEELPEALTSEDIKMLASEYSWKLRVQADMPWLWDMPLDQLNTNLGIDWHQVYLDLDRRSTFGAPDAILGLVNRRRIWKVCRQLAVKYAADVLPATSHHLDTDQDIEKNCASAYTPLLVHVPDQTQPQRMKVCFLSTISDMNTNYSLLKSYWNPNGHLTGISLEMQGCPKRLFGLEASAGGTAKSITIDQGDWVQGIRVFVSRAIEGLQVITSRQGLRTVKESEFSAHIDLTARPDTTFVGLEGEIADGIVTRLGLLEYSKDHKHRTLPPLSFTRRQLWYRSELVAPSMTEEVEAYPYHGGTWTSKSDEQALDGLTPILLRTDEDNEGRSPRSISASSKLTDLEFHSNATASMRLDMPGEDTQMKWFPVDGLNGERVVGIEVEVAECPSALRSLTVGGSSGSVFLDGKLRGFATFQELGIPSQVCITAQVVDTRNKWCVSALSLLSAPGKNETHLMFDAPRDEHGHLWESSPLPDDWCPSGNILGSSDARLVTWLDLTNRISRIEGLVAPPIEWEIFDLDGFKIIPHKDIVKQLASADAMETLDNVNPYEDLDAFQAWRKEEERSISVGTPPPAGFVPPKRRKLWPTRTKFYYPVDGAAADLMYNTDAKDGAMPHSESAHRSSTDVWEVPEQKLGGATVWAGTYLHGFQFHSASDTDSPRWGKCGGEPAAKWTIDRGGVSGKRDTCVGLKFFLSDTRGPYRLQELKVVGVQRLVLKAASLAKTVL
ncbi:MAG: hypothetical protein Q9169_000850 [Polycauliona sp. 2 TL-2023]